MKPTELEKLKGKQIENRVRAAGTPARFGAASATLGDRRQRRERERALGLVPFAVKVPAELLREIRAHAEARRIGVDELVAELLRSSLAK
ncbi:MAG: hypothetical protein WCA12_13320 [Burkholderiales bacterium]